MFGWANFHGEGGGELPCERSCFNLFYIRKGQSNSARQVGKSLNDDCNFAAKSMGSNLITMLTYST